jgi:hypothetical protein
MSADAPPTLARKIVAGIIVAAFAVGICWLVQWRSAAPPPPHAVGQFP